jgi:AraC-like DNA-binding protein
MAEGWNDFFRYLPVSPRDRQWGLYVTAVGFMALRNGKGWIAKGHSAAHDFTWHEGRVLQEYAIVYFTQGQCEFESNATGTLLLYPGDVLFLFPSVWHRYRPKGDVGWEQSWVTFQGEYADRLCERGFLRIAEPVLHAGVDARISRAFTALLDHVRGEPLGLQQIVAADALQILATILSAIHHRQTTSQVHEAVRRAKAAIEASAEGLPTIQQIAEEVGLSRSYFHQVFKECTGLSPYQYHLQVQVGRAQEFLRSSTLSVKQIAKAVKFRSPYQFCRTFKKKTGMTPCQYRGGGQSPKSRRRLSAP